MTKFHINKHGVPAPCRAKKGNCPLGGADTHFDNEADAQAYADSVNAKEFGDLPGIQGNQEIPYNDFMKGDLEALRGAHLDIEYDGKEFSGEVIGVHLEDNGSERNGLIIQDEDGNVKHIKVNRLESIEENRKIGEEYEVPHAINEDGTYDSDTYKLSDVKDYQGEKIHVYKDDRGYPYLVSATTNGKVDWEAIDKLNEAYEEDYKLLDRLPDYGSGESGKGSLTISAQEAGAKYVESMNRRSKVKPPEFALKEGKRAFRSIDDMETLIHTRGEFITTYEHNPVSLVQSQFDHVAGSAGKLYRYEEEHNFLETHEYDFEKKMADLEHYLENDGYFHEESEYDEGTFKEDSAREAFNADVRRHRAMHEYTSNLAIEYARDYEKKVVLGSKNFSIEKEDEIKEVYKKALANKVGQYIENYGDESYDEDFGKDAWYW